MGNSWAGTIVSLGPSTAAHSLSPGDKVFGFSFRSETEKSFQEYITTDTWLVGKVPGNLTFQEAVTVPTNLITAFHTLTKDLGLDLPWPIPVERDTGGKDIPILIWGAASSVGLYAVQVLRIWGYGGRVIAVASRKHHEELKRLGARECVDYNDPGVVDEILALADEMNGDKRPRIPLILDCIGSREGTLRPLTRIAERGATVAIMLPVINIHSSAAEGSLPEYEMDVSKVLVGEWAEGVELKGTRTHFYHEVCFSSLLPAYRRRANISQNEFFKYHLQPEIIPALLESGAVEPNKQRVVEGNTLLERAQKALDLLRERAPSGEKLVWRVAEE